MNVWLAVLLGSWLIALALIVADRILSRLMDKENDRG